MKKPFIIGIAGGSGSGKSTFSKKLLQSFNGYKVKLIKMDDYFKAEEALPTVHGFSSRENTYRDYNHPDSFLMDAFCEEVIFCAGSSDFDIVIVEGLLVLHNEKILDLLDLKIYIDCKDDERIVRRIRRNIQIFSYA